MLNMIKLKETYRHIKSGKIYQTKEFCKFKDTFSKEWIECVSYESINTESKKTYVRTLDNFAEKFEKIN